MPSFFRENIRHLYGGDDMFVQDPYIRDLCWLIGLTIGVLAWYILNKRS